MSKNMSNAVRLIAAVVLVAGLSIPITASSQKDTDKTGRTGKSTTVSGCLQKGDEPNEYAITENGKTYGLRSNKVDLSKHVGHQVSVSGTLRPEGKEEGEENEANEKKEANKEAGGIRITNLKMVKDACQ